MFPSAFSPVGGLFVHQVVRLWLRSYFFFVVNCVFCSEVVFPFTTKSLQSVAASVGFGSSLLRVESQPQAANRRMAPSGAEWCRVAPGGAADNTNLFFRPSVFAGLRLSSWLDYDCEFEEIKGSSR